MYKDAYRKTVNIPVQVETPQYECNNNRPTVYAPQASEVRKVVGLKNLNEVPHARLMTTGWYTCRS